MGLSGRPGLLAVSSALDVLAIGAMDDSGIVGLQSASDELGFFRRIAAQKGALIKRIITRFKT